MVVERKRIPARFYRAEGGSEPVRECEVRTNLPANRIARVLFCIAQGEMVLLHGFMKKSRKTPKFDLGSARDRKRRPEAER